jgi:hypothetical protein
MDGLVYAVQQGTARLVLCALPWDSGTAGRRRSRNVSAANMLVRNSLDSSTSPQADGGDDDESLQLDVVPAADSPEWKAICRALATHGFRLPGTTRHGATQCVKFLECTCQQS